MNRIEITIEIEEGLHTRPAGLIAELFDELEGKMITKRGEAKLSSMLSLMTLGVRRGETVIVETPYALSPEIQSKLRLILGG